MELTTGNKRFLNALIVLSAGILFIYVSVPVIGYGAAIAVPKEVILPLYNISPALALSAIDLVTIGLPVALLFCCFYWLLRCFISNAQPALLSAPFVVFMLYMPILHLVNSMDARHYLAISLAKLIPILISAYLLAKREKASGKIE